MYALSDNPPARPARLESLADAKGWWHVAQVRAQCEKPFATQLLGAGVDYFLPLIRDWRTYSGVRRQILRPLLTGYVFFAGEADARYAAIATHKVVRFIDVAAGKQAELVSRLVQLDNELREDDTLGAGIRVGGKYRIKSGGWRESEGEVGEIDYSKGRAKMWVEMFGQICELEIDTALLEAV